MVAFTAPGHAAAFVASNDILKLQSAGKFSNTHKNTKFYVHKTVYLFLFFSYQIIQIKVGEIISLSLVSSSVWPGRTLLQVLVSKILFLDHILK